MTATSTAPHHPLSNNPTEVASAVQALGDFLNSEGFTEKTIETQTTYRYTHKKQLPNNIREWIKNSTQRRAREAFARIVLACRRLALDGFRLSTATLSAQLGVSRPTISKWLEQFQAMGIIYLENKHYVRPGKGRVARARTYKTDNKFLLNLFKKSIKRLYQVMRIRTIGGAKGHAIYARGWEIWQSLTEDQKDMVKVKADMAFFDSAEWWGAWKDNAAWRVARLAMAGLGLSKNDRYDLQYFLSRELTLNWFGNTEARIEI